MRAYPMLRLPVTMMNVVAIGLVLSTLAAAGVWSPAPAPRPAAQHGGDHVVREGRRVVIVEYEREVPLSSHGDKETRVLPPHALHGREGEGEGDGDGEGRGVVSDAVGRVGDAAEEGKEKLSDAKDSTTGKVFGAVKRCKDRLCGTAKKAEEGAKDTAMGVEHGAEHAVRGAGDAVRGAAKKAEESAKDTAMGVEHGAEYAVRGAGDAVRGAGDALTRAKESAEDKARGAASRVKETTEGAKGKVSEAAGKAKDTASHVQRGAAETVKNAKDKVSDAAKQAGENAKDTAVNAKDKVSASAKHAGESAKEAAMNAKDRVSDIAGRAEQRAQDAAGSAVHKAAQAEEAVKAKAGEVSSNLTDILRRARGVASDAAAYLLGAPREAARTATALMHLLGFATAYGASVWVTFVSSYVLAAALPRQQLGIVQSKLFPVYFRAMAYGVGLALGAHLLGRDRGSVAERAQSFNLVAALALVLANMLFLEPKATKVMFERMKVEKEEGRGRDMADIVDPPLVAVATATTAPTAAVARKTVVADGMATTKAATGEETQVSKSRVVRLNQRLKKLNSLSSLCNVLALMALSWHLVHLARRFQMSGACG